MTGLWCAGDHMGSSVIQNHPSFKRAHMAGLWCVGAYMVFDDSTLHSPHGRIVVCGGYKFS